MSDKNNESSGAVGFLIGVSWVASIISLPIYLNAFVGIGMSPGGPNVSLMELLELAICPVIVIITTVSSLRLAKITVRQFVFMIPPALLSLCEAAFVCMCIFNK